MFGTLSRPRFPQALRYHLLYVTYEMRAVRFNRAIDIPTKPLHIDKDIEQHPHPIYSTHSACASFLSTFDHPVPFARNLIAQLDAWMPIFGTAKPITT